MRFVRPWAPRDAAPRRLTLHTTAECQRAGGVVAFIDAEHALDVLYAKNLGKQADTLLMNHPDTG